VAKARASFVAAEGNAHQQGALDQSILASKSYRALHLMRRAVQRDLAEKAVAASVIAPLAANIDAVAVELSQAQLASVLLEQGGERRWYEASTGVVYVYEIGDVVMPLMFSYCPLGDGCLRKGKRFWDESASIWQTFTLDLGVKATTLGTEDPRHVKQTGLLGGFSWNPFYFVRLSAGAYFFENAQRQRSWNARPYAGLTFDVLHAAELLGFVGLGVPEAPKAKSKEAASP
jgi:hypothetical protein